ncbi:MAG: pyridoxamine 5'-phosphate oxidase family protein [Candidatus Promineifilaceae bacterium]|nr:pyridoxamine 5'-phosphate oxidase family protein [Candidatus Promineifilaceae bacterium]
MSLAEEVLAYLRNHQVMTLATAGDDGPWAAAVFYANDGYDLYFLSAPTTRHSRHIATDPRAAAAIHEDYSDWRAIQGIQLEGPVTMLTAAEADAARTIYAEKYPFIVAADATIQRALQKVAWYRLRPAHLFFVDNQRGFGRREQLF